MSLNEQLFPRCVKAMGEGSLRGTRLSDADAALLSERLALPPDHWLLELMREAPVIEQMFDMPHPDANPHPEEWELEELGPERLSIRWLNMEDLLQHMTEYYPGMFARKLHYVALGEDVSGSDPIFVGVEGKQNRRVVQILHAACGKTRINPKGILPVLDDVDQLFEYVWNRPGGADRAGG